jgi:Helix-turn-helix domain
VPDPRLALAGEPPTLTVARAAELLGMPESEVRRLITAGTFPVVAVDDRLMVAARSLERWAAAAGEHHRAASAVVPRGHYLGDPAEAPADPGTLCPNCNAPLEPVTNYASARHGRLAVCPHSPTYFALDLPRPQRAYDITPIEPSQT